MKKLYILFALAIGFAFGLKAQTIEFSNEGTVIDDTVKFDISTGDFRTDFVHFKNITTESKTVIVQLHRMQLAADADLLMCFNGNCLLDTISTTPLVLAPNVEYDQFDLQYIYANKQTTIGKINILDASTMQVLQSFVAKYYDSTLVSLPKQVKPHFALSLDVYPNPVSNNATINYTLPSNYSNGQIVVRNMIGSTVKSTEIKSGVSGKYQFSTMELANGVYFYSIIGNGKTISTKKMVVKH